ncbi:hemerythrin [Sporobacter termitidis DSM 10068]|uniref:Hemerythrin n=1 Tax=Sporobacter termitidis DSM 10068 TaxID=1123282 RepID=A0A1M5WC93_9FIRM|nr:hemerythrin family protein [Sporobacter termitidis]SHH85081.1 hemerythrin [Sporobacter termitidis DSM 10068]
MTWRDSFALGIPQIDKQHRELCDQIDKLFEAGSRGKGADEVMNVLSFLESYTIRHFADEEQLQLQIKYPQYQQHKAKHAEFVAKIAKMKKEATEKGVNVALVISLNQMISNWLIEHIKSVDADYAKYYKP